MNKHCYNSFNFAKEAEEKAKKFPELAEAFSEKWEGRLKDIETYEKCHN